MLDSLKFDSVVTEDGLDFTALLNLILDFIKNLIKFEFPEVNEIA